MKLKNKILLLLLVCFSTNSLLAQVCVDEKKDGVSFVSPSNDFPAAYLSSVHSVDADWIALSPYAFARKGQPKITFDSRMQWWGERPEGIRKIIEYARAQNLKIMLKPQVWMMNSWVGEFDLESEEDWIKWETDYKHFILSFAEIAEENQIELFCIGTEYKIAAVKRPDFWNDLIIKVRKIYTGELTYSSNWDHYQNIPFWEGLDYIGISAYFQLLNEKTPEVSDLQKAWLNIKSDLKAFSKLTEKPILFTEYGYMSCDFTAWKNWENEKDRSAVQLNFEAQNNAFEALYKSLWNEQWFAGGFIWKWYHNDEAQSSFRDKDYTPQNKPVEEIIRQYYSN